MTKTIEEHKQKPCYGKNRCWNNVRIQCPVSDSCAYIQSLATTAKKVIK